MTAKQLGGPANVSAETLSGAIGYAVVTVSPPNPAGPYIYDRTNSRFDKLIQPVQGGPWFGETNRSLKFDPALRTLVAIHGEASTTDAAWRNSASKLMDAGAYKQLVGVDYTWQDPLDYSGWNVAICMAALKPTSFDMIAHGLGVPVAMNSLNYLSTSIVVPHFFSLCGAYCGTTVSDKFSDPQVKQWVNSMLGLTGNVPIVSLPQLTTTSPILKRIRDQFDLKRPNTTFYALAGNFPTWRADNADFGWKDIPNCIIPRQLKALCSTNESFDGIINTKNELGFIDGKDPYTHRGNMISVPPFNDGHVYIHEDPRVVNEIANLLSGSTIQYYMDEIVYKNNWDRNSKIIGHETTSFSLDNAEWVKTNRVDYEMYVSLKRPVKVSYSWKVEAPESLYHSVSYSNFAGILKTATLVVGFDDQMKVGLGMWFYPESSFGSGTVFEEYSLAPVSVSQLTLPDRHPYFLLGHQEPLNLSRSGGLLTFSRSGWYSQDEWGNESLTGSLKLQ